MIIGSSLGFRVYILFFIFGEALEGSKYKTAYGWGGGAVIERYSIVIV